MSSRPKDHPKISTRTSKFHYCQDQPNRHVERTPFHGYNSTITPPGMPAAQGYTYNAITIPAVIAKVGNLDGISRCPTL